MQFKSFMEALKGKQHKIDKNKNGQIDSQDFKLLRKEETEQTNESFEFNRAAIAKQRLQNLRHSGRKVRGASVANLMRAAGIREEEMDETDLDQLDEVMAKDATASDWIHDFVHSSNPKFEGKTKKERIKMALGAYYGQAREKQQMEAYDSPLDTPEATKAREDLKKTLLDIKKKDPKHPAVQDVKEGVQKADVPAYLRKQQGQAPLKLSDLKRKDTISDKENLAKLRNEEAEQIDEISLNTMKSAKDKLQDRAYDAHMDDNKYAARHYAGRAVNMKKKIAQKERQVTKEEVEGLEEGGHIPGTTPWHHSIDTSVHKFKPSKDKTGPRTGENPMSAEYKPHKPTNVPVGATVKSKAVKEDVEQIAELSIASLKSYIKGAKANKRFENDTKGTAERKGDHMMASDSAHIVAKRKEGIKAAKAKLNKEEASQEGGMVPFDGPYTKTPENVKDKSGAKHTPMSRARDLARQGMKQAMKEEYDVEISDEVADQILEAAKQYTGPVNVKVQVAGNAPHEEKWESAKKKPVKEEYDEDGNITYSKVTFKDFSESLLEGRAQYMVKATHKDTGRVKVTTYVADKDESQHSVQSRAEREHKPMGYRVDSIRRKDVEAHGEGDEDETGSVSQKRGRGRPAGAKSGARGPRIK